MVMGIAGCLGTEAKHNANSVYVALVRYFVEMRQINLIVFSSKTFCLCVFKRTRPLNVLSQIHFISFGSLLCVSHCYWKRAAFVLTGHASQYKAFLKAKQVKMVTKHPDRGIPAFCFFGPAVG